MGGKMFNVCGVFTLEQSKLEQLAEIEGQTRDELIEAAVFDAVVLGICINPDCDYTQEVEPDQSRGLCEACGTHSVASVLCLAGMI
jgi:hypothetical protein